ncbi:hypothetical protein ACLMJK_007997 [Lecanora helva]
MRTTPPPDYSSGEESSDIDYLGHGGLGRGMHGGYRQSHSNDPRYRGERGFPGRPGSSDSEATLFDSNVKNWGIAPVMSPLPMVLVVMEAGRGIAPGMSSSPMVMVMVTNGITVTATVTAMVVKGIAPLTNPPLAVIIGACTIRMVCHPVERRAVPTEEVMYTQTMDTKALDLTSRDTGAQNTQALSTKVRDTEAQNTRALDTNALDMEALNAAVMGMEIIDTVLMDSTMQLPRDYSDLGNPFIKQWLQRMPKEQYDDFKAQHDSHNRQKWDIGFKILLRFFDQHEEARPPQTFEECADNLQMFMERRWAEKNEAMDVIRVDLAATETALQVVWALIGVVVAGVMIEVYPEMEDLGTTSETNDLPMVIIWICMTRAVSRVEVLNMEAMGTGAMDTGVMDTEAMNMGAMDMEAMDMEAMDMGAMDREVTDREAMDMGTIDREVTDREALGGGVINKVLMAMTPPDTMMQDIRDTMVDTVENI